MTVILCIVFIICLVCSVVFRTIVFHPFAFVFYAVKDAFFYFKHREYDKYTAGLLNEYDAHFGGGKTLTVVHVVRLLFKRYNNKKVWCRDRKKFVTQKIHIISNVSLNGIPFEPLQSLSQICCFAFRNKKIDMENDTRTCLIVLLDEASSELNSRSFKTNINPEFLNALITSRHFNMSIFYTSQKFKLVDALLRSVTQTCIHCKKIWRIVINTYYNADEVELASDVSLVKPIARRGWFVLDKDYNAYDTLATVDKLEKVFDKNDYMSEEEVLQLRGMLNPDNDAIANPSRKLRRLRKRK